MARFLYSDLFAHVSPLELLWLIVGLLVSCWLYEVVRLAYADAEVARPHGGGEYQAARAALWLARCLCAKAIILTSVVLPPLALSSRVEFEPTTAALLSSLYSPLALLADLVLLGACGVIIYYARRRLQSYYRAKDSTEQARLAAEHEAALQLGRRPSRASDLQPPPELR